MKNNRLGKIDFSALNVPPEKLYEKSIKSKESTDYYKRRTAVDNKGRIC